MTRLLPFLLALGAAGPAHAVDHVALLGTYTGGESRGIYLVHLDGDTGALTAPELAAELPSPEFLALHPGGRFVYAVTQVVNDGKKFGAVAALSLDPATGRLTLLNQQVAREGTLAHLAIDPSGRMVVAASYGAGYVVSFPVGSDGRVGERAGLVLESGPAGPNHARQEAPHAHSVSISPDGKFAFVCDLGVDRVFSYRLAPETGGLAANDPACAILAPGTGPRHSKFSPDGKNFYVVDELDGTVTACRYDAAKGTIDPFQRVSTLPEDFHGRNGSSEIRVHPNGRFVYAANRGPDSLAVFERDPATGALQQIQVEPCGGRTPRNFALTPDGAWLLCAHQDSNDMSVFRIDPATGRLTATGPAMHVPKSVCVLFLR